MPSLETTIVSFARDSLSSSSRCFVDGRPDQRQSGHNTRCVRACAACVADETDFGALSEPQHSLRSLAKRSSGHSGRSRLLIGWWGPARGVPGLRDPPNLIPNLISEAGSSGPGLLRARPTLTGCMKRTPRSLLASSWMQYGIAQDTCAAQGRLLYKCPFHWHNSDQQIMSSVRGVDDIPLWQAPSAEQLTTPGKAASGWPVLSAQIFHFMPEYLEHGSWLPKEA